MAVVARVGEAVKGVLLTLLCVAGIACGQVLFKKGAQSLGADAGLTGLLFNSWILVALIIYGAATLLWIHVLRETALSVAYPLFALTFIIVPLLASILLNEPLQSKTLIGGVLIIVGVYWSIQGHA